MATGRTNIGAKRSGVFPTGSKARWFIFRYEEWTVWVKAVKNSLACLVAVFLFGCTITSIPQKHLSSEDFVRLYNNPGTLGDYWEYKGLKNSRHWLYHYGFRQPQHSVTSVMEKGFVDAGEMPTGFPSAPQPKPKPGESTDVKAGLEHWMKEMESRSQKMDQ